MKVPLVGTPRWVSARGGPYDRHVLRGRKSSWAVIECRSIDKPTSRRRYTHRVLMGPVAPEIAARLVSEGWAETTWRWDR